MAYFGLRFPFLASYNRNTGTYSNGFRCGKAVSIEISPNYSEGSLYGDNEKVEYEKVFTDADVTLGTTTLPLAAASVVFGHTVEDSKIIKKTTDEGHYVGLGIVVDEVIDGEKQYCAMITTCVQFAESAESFTTKGDSITFSTPSIAGKAIGDKSSQWVIKKLFDNFEDAVTYIKDYLNIEDEPVVTHTVTFDSDGGTAVAPQTVEDGGLAVAPENPTKSGYTFTGWYESAEATTAYDFSTPVKSDLTLTARWEEE